MKKLLIISVLALATRSAHALTVSGVTFSDTNIPYETVGIPNGTTIGFTIDGPGVVQIAVNCGIQNFGDAGTNVANLSQTYPGAGTYTATSSPAAIFWNGLWLMNG